MSTSQNDTKKQDLYLKNKVSDMIDFVSINNIPKFTFFLDERQQNLISNSCKTNNICNYLFFGGATNTQRNLLGVFPKHMDIDTSFFPISILKLEIFGEPKLSHRDYLGAIMGLQIRREMIGDILIDNNHCYVFVMSKIADVLLQDLKFIGNNSVIVITENVESINNIEQEFDCLSGTVSSLRLDCVVSFIIKKSRKISTEVIESGLLKLNYEVVQNTARNLKENDVITIRGFGKFVFLGCVKKTKKDKFLINIKVYK